MANNSQIKNWYLSLFKDFENHFNGERSSPFHEVRKQAIAKFVELDFPDLHQEDWRFTDISPILKYNFSYANDKILPSKNEISKFVFNGMQSHDIVFVNGFYSPELSTLLPLPNGTVLGNFASFIKSTDVKIGKHVPPDGPSEKDAYFYKNIFTALNTAFAEDGAFIRIPENVVIEKPIHLFLFHTVWKKQSRSRKISSLQAKIRKRKLSSIMSAWATEFISQMP